MLRARSVSVTSSACGARKATSASRGNDGQILEQQDRDHPLPLGRAISPRSLSDCITMAVEVRTNPVPAISDWA